MPFTADVLIGNTNTYQVTDFRDAVTADLETGVELYQSLCAAPANADAQKITGATNMTPIVVTSAAHGLATGAVVTIVNVGGNGAAKGTFTITRVSADTFSLNGSIGDGNYTNGGQWYQCLASAAALALTDEGDGLYSVDVDGSIGLLANVQYVVVFYCLGAYRDVFNNIVRVVARVRGST